jgi:hypothetical protein
MERTEKRNALLFNVVSVSVPDILDSAQGICLPLSGSRVCRLFPGIPYSRTVLFFQDGKSNWQTDANYKIVAPLLNLPCNIYILPRYPPLKKS